jgi:hypothetical protein
MACLTSIDEIIRWFIIFISLSFYPLFVHVMADLIRHLPIEQGIAGLRPQ